MARIFVSYKRKDKEKVFKIVRQIEEATTVKCWIDLDGIESSSQFAPVICKAIDNAEIVLFMYSSVHRSVDFEMDWTIKELNYAMSNKKRIVLVNLDSSPLFNVFLMQFGTSNNIDSNDPLQMNRLFTDLCKWLNISGKLEGKRGVAYSQTTVEGSQPSSACHNAHTSKSDFANYECTPEEKKILAFRVQCLERLAKRGCDIKAREIYFDPERASSINGFVENKYFPRKSVDGRIKSAIDEKLKFIILNGAPGSGKTRALYQLLAKPTQWALDNHKEYALGCLSNEKVIVVNNENVQQVYEFLKSEEEYDFSIEPSYEYYLVCDQLKNVFDNRLTNDDIYKFFDIVSRTKHIRMIATTIPSAFEKLCERWNGYTSKPLKDDSLTKVIKIPQISSDKEEETIRNWMRNEFNVNPAAETIGDFIPQLNDYKQNVVKRLYEKVEDLPYLRYFLSAIQITETFRYDTALFLPVLFMQKNTENFDKHETVRAINYLIENNVIWVRKKSNDGQSQVIIHNLQDDVFKLDKDIDDEENYIFDNETFDDTTLSTAYTYDINEIIWDEIELEDSNRENMYKATLLINFNKEGNVVRAAKMFYRAFKSISSLRRILPRIPQTDCYDAASKNIWKFVYKELRSKEMSSHDDEIEEFLTTAGILIGRSQEPGQIDEVIRIIEEKNLRINYGIIGELYSVGLRLGIMDYVAWKVAEIREEYELYGDSLFSLERKIDFDDLSFDDALKAISDNDFLKLNNATNENKDKFEILGIERLINSLAKRGDTIEQWNEIFKLHRLLRINIRRSVIRRYFSVVAVQEKRQRQEKNTLSSKDLLFGCLGSLLKDFDDIIIDDDKGSCFFYAIANSCNFRQAHSIYQLYVGTFKNHNHRLISMVLHTVLDHEYQKALLFMKEIEDKGYKINDICYNNLIKSAPNMGEAMDVIPYIKNIQDHTLANILSVLKSKRQVEDENSITGYKQDPKVFFYAYSVVMREEFAEVRKSPYVIGLLYELATTPKHERFIREKILDGLDERKKCEIIDYSTSVTSIRLLKNYRNLNEIWDIFNKCRDHYEEDNLFIKSELYSTMIRKLLFLSETDGQLEADRKELAKKIKMDYDRIIRDEYFKPAFYRLVPENKVIDNQGNISNDFVNELRKMNISVIRPLNTIMSDLKTEGFDVLWNLFEFIVQYYHKNGNNKSLRPDIRTITYLMETVTTKEQFELVEETSRYWGMEASLRQNKIYNDKRNSIRKKLGIYNENVNKGRDDNKGNRSLSYEQRTNNVIKSVKKEVDLYGYVTPTQFNQYLAKIDDIIHDINNNKYIDNRRKFLFKIDTYNNVLENLINIYEGQIYFNALSYVYLIKFTPKSDVNRWIDKLKDMKGIYQYDFVTCAAIAQSEEICDKDIELSFEYYKFWETIINDIGYNPEDPDSFSDATEVKDFHGVADFDGYWLTRHAHCKCEMFYYVNHLKDSEDNDKKQRTLHFIKQQIDSFERYGIQVPYKKLAGEPFDFKQEIGNML